MRASQLRWTVRWMDQRTQSPERDTEVDHRDLEFLSHLLKCVCAVNLHINTMDITTTTASVSIG